mgnify:CR=1 FL=1|jgi:hypothetical protein|tara:strand:+ start:149 stop:553 length:405 start_codon:yes stop_codon:yes gene_type:complete
MKFLLPKEIKDFFYRKQSHNYSEKERLEEKITTLQNKVERLLQISINQEKRIFKTTNPPKFKTLENVGNWIICSHSFKINSDFLDKLLYKVGHGELYFKYQYHCIHKTTKEQKNISEEELLTIKEQTANDNNRN